MMQMRICPSKLDHLLCGKVNLLGARTTFGALAVARANGPLATGTSRAAHTAVLLILAAASAGALGALVYRRSLVSF